MRCTVPLLAWSLAAAPCLAAELTIEADLEFAHERQGDTTASEATFDEVGFVVTGAQWELETGIKYKSSGGRGLAVEEVALRLGASETIPWLVQLGRTMVPFGEYDAQFIEDPLIVNVGETDADAVSLGFEGERVGLSATLYRGDFYGNGDLDFVLAAAAQASPALRFGASWSSDVGESVELRELRRDVLEANPLAAEPADGVQGLAASVTVETGRWMLHLESVTALESFPAGALAGGSLRPGAWNLEYALRPAPRWELAWRLEASHELPDSPGRQYGMAVSWTHSEYVTVTAEYLRGSFEGAGPDLDLLGLKFALAY